MLYSTASAQKTNHSATTSFLHFVFKASTASWSSRPCLWYFVHNAGCMHSSGDVPHGIEAACGKLAPLLHFSKPSQTDNEESIVSVFSYSGTYCIVSDHCENCPFLPISSMTARIIGPTRTHYASRHCGICLTLLYTARWKVQHGEVSSG